MITLHEGDNRDSLRKLIDQGVRVHSVVTDPPYGLVSVQKRFGKPGSAAARAEGNDGYRKLNAQDVAAIRSRYRSGETNKSALAREFGVTPTRIRQVING